MAADCILTKSYVVLIISTDPVNANIMWDWGGHQKIAHSNIGTEEPLNYQLRKHEIDLWIDFYINQNHIYTTFNCISFLLCMYFHPILDLYL